MTLICAVIAADTPAAAEAMKVAEQIAGEGFVLLENEDDLLPLDGTDKLNLFGWSSVNPVYGGAGSGGINDLYEKVSLEQGLEDAGFTLNSELHDFYTAYTPATARKCPSKSRAGPSPNRRQTAIPAS